MIPLMSFSQNLGFYDLEMGMSKSQVESLLHDKGLVIRNRLNAHIFLGGDFENEPYNTFEVDFSGSGKLDRLNFVFGPYKESECIEMYRRIKNLVSNKFSQLHNEDLTRFKLNVKPKTDTEILEAIKNKKGSLLNIWIKTHALIISLFLNNLDQEWVENGFFITLGFESLEID